MTIAFKTSVISSSICLIGLCFESIVHLVICFVDICENRMVGDWLVKVKARRDCKIDM